MRCPKCGFISFDNLDSCLKCKKNISDTAQAFKGSTLKVQTPTFLKLQTPDEEDMQIEGAAEVGGEIEFSDPDLEILVDDEEQDEIDFSLEEDDDAGTDIEFSEDFEGSPTFEDEAGAEEEMDLSADLGQFEDVPEEDAFAFTDDEDDEEDAFDSAADADFPAMDIPDELDDISDLSPPETPETAERY